MDKSQIRQVLDDARKAKSYEGNSSRAYRLLQPLIEEGNPEALYLFSEFGLRGESREEFDQRSARLLMKAAEQEYPPAQYALGIYYWDGDCVEEDKIKATALFKASAMSGYPKAQRLYAFDLYYGMNGTEKNTELGLEYMRKAAEAGDEYAIEDLADWEKS